MFWVCVCSGSYPGCKVHAPYHTAICSLSALQYFSTWSLKRHASQEKKNVTEHKMCVLIFLTTFFSDFSHSKKKWARYHKKYTGVYVKYPLFFCWILMKLEFSREFFENYSRMKFNGVVPCGWRDVHNEAKSRFSPFCEGVWQWTSSIIQN